MSNKTCLNVEITEDELGTIITGLLFSCSVNIVSETSSEFQNKLYELANKLKTYKEDIKLEGISFIKEENYEDETSQKILEKFHSNLDITTFDQV